MPKSMYVDPAEHFKKRKINEKRTGICLNRICCNNIYGYITIKPTPRGGFFIVKSSRVQVSSI